VLPAAGATGVADPVLFTWDTVKGGDGYYIQISKTDSTAGLTQEKAVAKQATDSTSFSLEKGVTRYWRIRVTSANKSDTCTYSGWRKFTVVLAPH
jgi:hypothetical protein